MENAPPPASSPAPKRRKPWPMAWIAATIVACIVAYTLINLGYRKKDGAHEPWAEALERREEVRQEALLEWTRFHVALTPAKTAAAPPPHASVSRGPAPGRLDEELPIELVMVIPARPELASAPEEVLAPATIQAEAPWRIGLQFAGATPSQNLGEPLVYASGRHLRVFLQNGKRLAPETAPVPAKNTLEIAFPPASLAPGKWTATLYCADATLTWPFVVE
ncbi:MAG: hypothetical protein ACREIA_19810 [Opitutaceae bacterium]